MPSSTGQNLQHVGQYRLNESLMTGSESATLVALAGGGQTGATALPDGCNVITTVGTTSDSVMLPTAKSGKVVYVANQGAQTAQAYGQGIDTINAVATGTGVSLASGKNAVFFCTKSSQAANNVSAAIAGTWYMITTA